MRSQSSWFGKLDKLTIGLFLFIVLFGWMNIYSTVNPKMEGLGWDWNNEAGRQLLFMGFSGVLIFLVLLSDGRLYEVITVPIYVISALLLVAVLFIGKEVGGNKSWLALGNFGLQPSEFAKLGTALMTARIVSQRGTDLRKWNARWWPIGAIAIPMGLILLQPDTGSAIVFLGFFLVLYREGLPGYLLFLGIGAFLVGILALAFSQTVVFILVGIVVGVVLILERLQHRMKLMQTIKHKAVWFGALAIVWSLGVDQIFHSALQPHQQLRIQLLLGQVDEPNSAGYQTAQSLIAIGSGGFVGKGYTHGTQTKLDFVPAQTTDYIFCTVGEEWGFLGSSVVLLAFASLIGRLIFLAERQKEAYARIYGYGIASILLIHYIVNIGMTLGLMPVIGIPLPFFSYGGSSLWAFSLMLFVFLRMDSFRWQTL
jgi:rod shape determining protein RodA